MSSKIEMLQGTEGYVMKAMEKCKRSQGWCGKLHIAKVSCLYTMWRVNNTLALSSIG